MKKIKRYLPAMLVALFVLGIFGYIKVRADRYDYEVVYTDTCEDGTAYGADIGFSKVRDSEGHETGEVEAFITNYYSGVNVNIPATVSFGGITYSVASLGNSYSVNYDEMDGTITVPEDLRTIYGNLFDWNVYKDFSSNRNMFDEGFYFERYEIGVPDSEAVVAGIPASIKNNYVNGAYYLGKCLLRVDPNYVGDFTVKDGTVCILASAFEGCKSIGAVSIPDSVEFIGMRAFTNSSVTSVNLPSGLTGHSNYIADYTFYGCHDLQTVAFGEGVTLNEIRRYAFMDCSSLTGFDFSKAGNLHLFSFAGAFDPSRNVELTLNTRTLGNGNHPGVFAGSGIKGVTFVSDASDTINNVPICCFYNCKKLDDVNLSDTVYRFSVACFEGCESLKEDILAQESCKVTYLDYRCLARTSLTEVTIPATLTGYAGGVLAEVPTLSTVNWYGSVYNSNLFSFLNDCGRSGSGSSFVMTGTDGYSSNSGYLKQPEKNGNTFVTTLNIYVPIDSIGGGYYGTDFFALQPYLETVNIHNAANTPVEIPYNFMHHNRALKNVNIDHPECITKIGSCAFEFCPSLNSFPFDEMPELTTIGSNAFMPDSQGAYGYSAADMKGWTDDDVRKGYGLLGELDLSKNTKLTSIQDAAFQMQYNITGLKLGKNAQLSSGVFVGCASLKEIISEGSISNLNDGGIGTNFTIPISGSDYRNYFGGTFVVFNDVIETITIKDAGSIINPEFFHDLVGLKNVTLEKLPTLGIRTAPGTFVNCIALENVNLPDTVYLYGDNIFYGCGNVVLNAPKATTTECCSLRLNGMKNIYLPELTTIEATNYSEQPFHGCTQLETVRLPKLKTVGNHYFSDFGKLSSLKSVELTGATTVSDNAFFYTPLETVELPNAETIGAFAFFGSPNLKTVKLPKAKTFVENSTGMTFANCPVLESVEIDSSQTNINFPSYMFMHSGIKSFSIPRKATLGKFMFLNCDRLESLYVEDGVEKLSWFLCVDCDNLESVTLPNTLKEIGWGAFKNCPKLKAVSIPASVTKIDDDAFALNEENHDSELKVYLTGAPTIVTAFDSTTYEERKGIIVSDSAIASLMPIPDNATIVTLSDKAFEAANNYKTEGGASLAAIKVEKADAYDLKIENGSGSGKYVEGYKVIVKAYDLPNGVFEKWESEDIEISDPTAKTFTIDMPGKDIKIKAVHKITKVDPVPYYPPEPETHDLEDEKHPKGEAVENVETKEDGTTVTTTTLEEEDGTTIKTVRTEKPDGSVKETEKTVSTDGTVVKKTVTENTNGVVKESVKTTNPDGSNVVTTKTENKEGVTVETEKATAVDGSVTVSRTTTGADGATASNTIELDADGNITSFTTEKTTSSGKKTEASYSASGNNLKVTNIQSDTTTVKIPATVKGGDGKQYKVTTIGANALGDAKVKTVVLGKNIKTIEANAFNGQSKLKTITVNGKLKSVGKGAFNGINKNATIKISGVSKNDYKKNMKLLQKSGLPKGVKIVWEK